MFARLSSELCTLSAMSCPSSVGSMWMLYVDSFFFFFSYFLTFALFLPPAVAEVGDTLGAPRLSVLSGLGDGSGWDGLLSDAGHQPVWTERVHTEVGGPLLLTPDPVTFHLPEKPAPSPITASKTWAETAALTEWRCMSPSRRGAAVTAAGRKCLKTSRCLFTVHHEKKSSVRLSGLDQNITEGRDTSEMSGWPKVCLSEADEKFSKSWTKCTLKDLC